MLPVLLIGAALASDETELPPAPTTRPAPPVHGSALWIGVTPPMVAVPLVTASPLAMSMDVDVRFPSRVGWVQPELRVAGVKDFVVTDGALLPGADTVVFTAFGARFGREEGFYGGLLGGMSARWSDDAGSLALGTAYTGYAGYAFRMGEHVRVSPELTMGTVNMVAVRVEWGG